MGESSRASSPVASTGSPLPSKIPKALVAETTPEVQAPNAPASANTVKIPHLKRGEELLDPEVQAKLIKRRARDAERKRQDRIRMIAARDAAAAASAAGPSTTLTDTPPNIQHHIQAADKPSDSTVRASSETASAGSSASTPAAPSKSKAAVEKKKAANAEKAAAAAQRLAAEKAAALAAVEDEEEEEEEEEDQKLYCICRTLYDEERMMIACDRCDEWFHTLCMEMNDEQVELVDMFICPRCEPSTGDRTTYKPACLRASCTHAARPPLSRYCSDRCGMLAAAARLAKTKYAKMSNGGPERLYNAQVRTATKKEGMVVWSTDDELTRGWLQSLRLRPASITNGHAQALSATTISVGITAESEALDRLQNELGELLDRRQEVSTRLDLAENRLKLLQLADDRIAILPPITVEEVAAPSKKAKAKGKGGSSSAKPTDGAASVKTQPRCGYDDRLSWDDERFEDWMSSENGRQMLDGIVGLDGRLIETDSIASEDDGRPTICGLARRRCKRHADWHMLRTEDFDIEKVSQTAVLSGLSERVTLTQTRIADITAKAVARSEAVDAKLAATLASEKADDARIAVETAPLINGRH